MGPSCVTRKCQYVKSFKENNEIFSTYLHTYAVQTLNQSERKLKIILNMDLVTKRANNMCELTMSHALHLWYCSWAVYLRPFKSSTALRAPCWSHLGAEAVHRTQSTTASWLWCHSSPPPCWFRSATWLNWVSWCWSSQQQEPLISTAGGTFSTCMTIYSLPRTGEKLFKQINEQCTNL